MAISHDATVAPVNRDNIAHILSEPVGARRSLEKGVSSKWIRSCKVRLVWKHNVKHERDGKKPV